MSQKNPKSREVKMVNYNPRCVSAPAHSQPVFDLETFLPLVESMAAKIELIRARFPEIEALAARGNSGVVLAGALSFHCKLPLIVVRKSLDTAHDSRMANGYIGAKAYLFIDDLISSGHTVDETIKEIDAAARLEGRVPPKFIGALLYDSFPNKNLPAWFMRHSERIPGFIWYVNAPDIEIDWDSTYDNTLRTSLGGPRFKLPNVEADENLKEGQYWKMTATIQGLPVTKLPLIDPSGF